MCLVSLTYSGVQTDCFFTFQISLTTKCTAFFLELVIFGPEAALDQEKFMSWQVL